MALWGALTILGVLVAILTRRLSPLAALIFIPILTAVAAGFGLHTSAFVITGIQGIAPVIAMFVFAILFFGVLSDAGMMAPLIHAILRAVGKSPTRIVPGTFLLALLVHLDGSGAVVFLVVIPALLPLYEELGIDRRILACAASMAAGVNFLPWTGPTLRASAAMHVSTIALFRPLIPVQLVGIACGIGLSFWLGRKEQRRLGTSPAQSTEPVPLAPSPQIRCAFWHQHRPYSGRAGRRAQRPHRAGRLLHARNRARAHLQLPQRRLQRKKLEDHARAAITMTAILCAAGSFTGILRGTGMLSAMAGACVHAVPAQWGHHIPLLVAVLGMPLSLAFDPDSWYFGVLPVIASAAGAYGVAPIKVAQASLLGMHTTGFPVSPLTPATFLVTGLAGVDLGEHQRFTGPFLFVLSIVMTLAAVLLGVIPL